MVDFKNDVHVRLSRFGVDFKVSLQNAIFCSVSMRVHKGYSCNEPMPLAALKHQLMWYLYSF